MKIEYGEFYGNEDIGNISVEGIDEISESAYASSFVESIEGVIRNARMYAFSACEKLRGEITIGGESLGRAAFERCPNLSKVTFLDELKDIEAYAFDECESLKQAIFPNSIKSIGECAFCRTGLIEITLKGIQNIGKDAFKECQDLRRISIEKLDGKFDKSAISGCNSLKDVTINGIQLMSLNEKQTFKRLDTDKQGIAWIIFEENGKEDRQKIPNELEKMIIGYNERALHQSVHAKGDVSITREMIQSTQIPSGVLRKNKDATSLHIGEGVTSTGDSICDKCSNLTAVSFPSTIQEIGESAFQDANLTSIDLRDTNVDLIKGRGFHVNRNLREIHLSDSLREIDYFGIAGCTLLKEIDLPNSVEKVGKGAFARNLSLNRIHISESLKEIPEYLLMGCKNLQEIYVPDSVKKISTKAFSLTGIESLRVPENVEVSNDFVLGCKKLKSLIIGDKRVMNLGETQTFSRIEQVEKDGKTSSRIVYKENEEEHYIDFDGLTYSSNYPSFDKQHERAAFLQGARNEAQSRATTDGMRQAANHIRGNIEQDISVDVEKDKSR